jgi:hypothetical protein
MLPPGVNVPNTTSYVLVDFENVCDIDANILNHKDVRLVLLVGATRKTLDLDFVEKLLPHAASVRLVRLASSGKNALDFALAYYLGCATTTDPAAAFHIISKDKGYDPLVEHLQSKHVRVRRHEDCDSFCAGLQPKTHTNAPTAPAPTPKPAPKPGPPAVESMSNLVLAHLRKSSASRPRSRKTLVSYVVTHLGNGTSQGYAESVVEHLSQSGYVAVDPTGTLTYWLEN